MKDNKGFSLVELLVVVAIMGILSGFVFIDTNISVSSLLLCLI